MPVEIRELVIQARLNEEAGDEVRETTRTGTDASRAHDGEETPSILANEDEIEQLVERCLLRLQEWLAERAMR